MKTIKEKVLNAVKKEYNWWEMREPEELLFNEIINEVGKGINEKIRELEDKKGGRYGVKYPNQTIKIKIKVLEELKQKLGTK